MACHEHTGPDLLHKQQIHGSIATFFGPTLVRLTDEDGTMAVDEAARHQLYIDLESALGPESTSTLMSLLPPVGWADVATRQDLRVLENGIRAELHQEVGALRADVHGDIGALRSELHGDLGALRVQFQRDLGTMRTQLHGQVGSLSAELRQGLADLHASQRTMLFSMLGAMFTLAGLTWAATSLA